MPDIPVCRLCATWECIVCNHRYYYQNPNFTGRRSCKQCGSPRGSFFDVRHSSESLMQDHVDIHRFAETTDHKFEHYRSFDQYATFLARQEMEEAMPESPTRKHTAQDFEKAEWAKHPAGMFAHRGGPHVGGAAWAVASPVSDDVTYYTDVELADRGDFEIVETATVITRRKLNQIEDAHNDGVSVEEILVQAGVKIVDDKPLPIPQDFGIRFVAKKDDWSVEGEFVTVRVNDKMMILCTDVRDQDGLLVTPAEFITRGFHVMALL